MRFCEGFLLTLHTALRFRNFYFQLKITKIKDIWEFSRLFYIIDKSLYSKLKLYGKN